MEFVKKHLFLVVMGVAVLITGAIGEVLILGKNKQIKEFEEDVQKIIAAEQSFLTSNYALINDNVINAEENFNKLEEKFNSLIKQLEERYPPPVVAGDMTPLKFKLNLRRFCIKLENLLRGEDVYIPDNMKYFSFDNYMRPDVLPDSEEINMILKQLEIINELMYLISQSQIDRLQVFKRVGGHTMVKRDFYSYMPFALQLSGDIESIQNFMNSLNDAKYFFMPRKFSLNAREAKKNARRGGKNDEALPKRKRMAYSSKPTEVTVNLDVDYFEFHN